MACGVPAVVSETLNLAKEFAESGAAVALPRNANAFSAAILNLLGDPDLRRKMGECGEEFVQRYSLQETGAKVAATLESILERRPLPAYLAPVTANNER
jgi:glycosyltransferase involved in cell wall biosynthesis